MEDFTWGMVALVSAAISAVVGAVVSLLAVSQTTIRQRQAERRDEARQSLRRTLQPLRAQVRKYDRGLNPGAQRTDALILDDHALATKVLAAAEQLGPVRRWLVRRRARRVFGPFVWAVADVAPTSGDGASLALLFAGSHPEKYGLEGGDDVYGLLLALRSDPGSPEVRRLDRQLALLTSGY